MAKILSVVVLILAGVLLTVFLRSVRSTNDERVPGIDTDLASIIVALREFKEEYGSYPSGSNRDIFHALLGQNPRRIFFLNLSPRKVRADGDFLDQWGTPYMIYFSGNAILVRSAGPNKTFDDNRQFRKTDDYYCGDNPF